ncbi:MAG TPA: restriction endonuclease subunit S [Chitinophagales bacterium]|nr:restriction endonuclease subunit S [Chitinophagales bacterium]
MEKGKGKKPNIRFPEFKDDWQHSKLSELLSEAKKRNEELKYGKDEVLSVSGELGIVNQIEHLGRSYAGASVHNYHVVETGDIVYTKSPLKANPFGIIKLNKGKAGIVSTLYAVYKVSSKTCYGPWLDYYFSLDANTNRYLRPLVRKGAKNTLQISNEEAISAEIFAPSIPEQKRIAAFFTVVDKKIAELKQKKALLEQYKKGVMQKLFSQELRFKDENGKEFPKWEKKKLGEMCRMQAGKFINATEIYNESNSELFPCYGGNGLRGYTRTFNQDGKYPLIGRQGAHCGNVTLAEGKFHATEHAVVVYSKTGFNVDWMFYLLHTLNLNQYSTGLAQPGLSVQNIEKVEAFVPISIVEQTKIANFLSAIDQKINKTENQIQQAQDWKKGLLQNMFV